MIPFLKTHKKHIAIACAAILLCSWLTALCVSRSIQTKRLEPVPTGRVHDAGDFGDNIIVHDSTMGEVVIEANTTETAVKVVPLTAAPLKTVADPEAIWNEDAYTGNHTPVEKVQMKNGSIGVLTIPALNLSVNVYESPDNMAAMSKGVAHFPSTSAYDGNVALSAHNINFDGSDGYFKYLYTLKKGDTPPRV